MTLLERDREKIQEGIEQGIEQTVEIFKLFMAGVSVADIAQKRGMCPDRVAEVIQKLKQD